MPIARAPVGGRPVAAAEAAPPPDYIDIAAGLTARYATGSHRRETLISPSGEYPSQLKWSDLHPPGVRVLPKGSPPAGPSEINWENTLGGKFALALTKLEGLLYALYGSRPNAKLVPGQPDPVWLVWQWYDRQHPRCLWGAEVWEPGPSPCFHYVKFAEYVALGEMPPCCDFKHPTVPIRSRSGDPAGQYQRGAHDRTVFPLGSVQRSFETFPFDPEGAGWFGATQPGRQDAVGFEVKAGDAVTFGWARPDGVQAPTSVELYHQSKPPGGSWSGWTATAMTEAGGIWSVELPAEAHGTELRWYLRCFYDDPGGEDIERFEPGGEAAPADEDAHYLQWFTHYNPYEHGFPEMLDDYNGVDVRHGTDFYQFDGSETIQPELLNLVRFAISYICGTTCLNSDGGCNEQPFGSVAHHNPRFRGSPDQGLCCVPMPIRFYWSGSNRFSHFRRRGKGDPADWAPLDTRPLKNRPDEPVFDAAQSARKSWRGIDNLYRDPPMDNPFYGGGVSWGTAPAELQLWDEPAHGGEAVYALYQHVGLQEGDVIDPVHIQEIIDAVDYLIDYGVWSHAAICTRQRTPSSYLGWPCGYQETARACTGCDPLECEPDSMSEILNCNRCCPEWDHNGTHCSQPGWVCDEHPPPTLEDCRSDCRDEKCGMSVTKSANTCVLGSGCCIQDRNLTVDCAEGTPIGCGSHSAGPGACPEGAETPGGGYGACGRRAEGMSYYACTPDKCEHGWDDQHGGSFKKSRFDDDCPVNNVVATGPPGNEFSGNCWGDIWSCGYVYPLGGEGDGPIAGGPIGSGSAPVPYACARMWFGQVAAIQWDGLAVPWLSGCDGFVPCGGGGDPMALPPPLPGLGLHDVDGDPLCTVFPDSHACICSLADFPVCKGESVWVAMDLNLDGTGRPYGSFPGRSCELSSYSGPGVPVLRDYDLTKDPDTWMHDCPCETWTGAGVCM